MPDEQFQDHLLSILENAREPVKRKELAARICPWAWKQGTKERRVREWVDALVLRGYPIVSAGAGFYIASSRGEFEQALTLRERAVLAESVKLKRLRGMLNRMQYREAPKQSSLFGEAT